MQVKRENNVSWRSCWLVKYASESRPWQRLIVNTVIFFIKWSFTHHQSLQQTVVFRLKVVCFSNSFIHFHEPHTSQPISCKLSGTAICKPCLSKSIYSMNYARGILLLTCITHTRGENKASRYVLVAGAISATFSIHTWSRGDVEKYRSLWLTALNHLTDKGKI